MKLCFPFISNNWIVSHLTSRYTGRHNIWIRAGNKHQRTTKCRHQRTFVEYLFHSRPLRREMSCGRSSDEHWMSIMNIWCGQMATKNGHTRSQERNNDQNQNNNKHSTNQRTNNRCQPWFGFQSMWQRSKESIAHGIAVNLVRLPMKSQKQPQSIAKWPDCTRTFKMAPKLSM